MIFTELRFLPFFVVVFVLHWLLRGARSRKVLLLAASWLFYGAWDWRFLSLLWISTLLDFVVGLGLERAVTRRNWWLAASLVGNLGLLGFFKYFNFFVDSAAALLERMGFEPHVWALQVVLPVGISFYTFQTLSYAIDVWRGRLAPTRSLLDFSLFVAFFPQLVAGPIVRASDFLPQMAQVKRIADVDFRSALVLLWIGFVKKACVSDNLAPAIDAYFRDPASHDALAAWSGVLSYGVQIYCDFSGYSDMAIAFARLFGYELALNFDAPYLATSITELWRRWHISFSTWLRDYLYVPLGGNRGSRLATYKNVMLTMLLGGLWHGAGWNFVAWGGLHGAALLVHREWQRLVPERVRHALAWIGWPLTQWWFFMCLIPFRSEDTGRALVTLRSFVLFQSPGTQSAGWLSFAIIAGLLATHVATRLSRGSTWWRRGPDWLFAAGYAAVAALTCAWMGFEVRPFIYFQF